MPETTPSTQPGPESGHAENSAARPLAAEPDLSPAPGSEAEGEGESWREKRWRRRDVRVFAAMDVMDELFERIWGVIGQGRVMNTVSGFVPREGLRSLSSLNYATGLRIGGHEAHPEGYSTWRSEDQAGFAVYLTHDRERGSLNSVGVGVQQYNAASEVQVQQRWNRVEAAMRAVRSGEADDQAAFLASAGHRDITVFEVHGRPGQPHREDRIEVLHYNEHGVLWHVVVTFVEPDYCDSGRVEERNYVVMGTLRGGGDSGEVFAVVPVGCASTDQPEAAAESDELDEAAARRRLEQARRVAVAERNRIQQMPEVSYAWVAEESVTRCRNSV